MKSRRESPKYRARFLLWHSVTEEYIEPGNLVNLDHLEHDRILMLMSMGYIEEVMGVEVMRFDPHEPEEQ